MEPDSNHPKTTTDVGPVAPPRPRSLGQVKKAGRRVGYGVSLVIQVITLVVVNNIVDWGWLSWLTDDFDQVVGITSLAIVVSMMVNLFYLLFPAVYDITWIRALGAVVTDFVSLVATVRLYRVFPFDFADYSFDWEAVARVGLIVIIVATAVAIVVHLVQFVFGLVKLGNG